MQTEDESRRVRERAELAVNPIIAHVARGFRCNYADISVEDRESFISVILAVVAAARRSSRTLARAQGRNEMDPVARHVAAVMMAVEAGARIAQDLIAEDSRRLRDPHGRPTVRNPTAPRGTYRSSVPPPRPRRDGDTDPMGADLERLREESKKR